jgi:hypothetical protein
VFKEVRIKGTRLKIGVYTAAGLPGGLTVGTRRSISTWHDLSVFPLLVSFLQQGLYISAICIVRTVLIALRIPHYARSLQNKRNIRIHDARSTANA